MLHPKFNKWSFFKESLSYQTAADYVYISESNENWEKYFNREMIQPLVDFVRCSDYKFLEIISWNCKTWCWCDFIIREEKGKNTVVTI